MASLLNFASLYLCHLMFLTWLLVLELICRICFLLNLVRDFVAFLSPSVSSGVLYFHQIVEGGF